MHWQDLPMASPFFFQAVRRSKAFANLDYPQVKDGPRRGHRIVPMQPLGSRTPLSWSTVPRVTFCCYPESGLASAGRTNQFMACKFHNGLNGDGCLHHDSRYGLPLTYRGSNDARKLFQSRTQCPKPRRAPTEHRLVELSTSLQPKSSYSRSLLVQPHGPYLRGAATALEGFKNLEMAAGSIATAGEKSDL